MMGKRYEHIYIIEKPGGRWINLKFDQDNPDLVFYALPGQVNKMAEDLEQLLRSSGNKRGLKIFVFRFQSGEFCNEDDEEYIARLEADIGKTRIEQHVKYKKDEAFYQEVHHGEKKPITQGRVYEWNL